jgi:hypothetical protein
LGCSGSSNIFAFENELDRTDLIIAGDGGKRSKIAFHVILLGYHESGLAGLPWRTRSRGGNF